MKKMMIGFSLVLSVAVWGQKNSAQSNKPALYSYQTFGCDNKGYFDPSKYKKEEIDGTYKLLYPLDWSPFSSLIVFNPTKFDHTRNNSSQLLQQAEKDYQTRKKELLGLKTMDLPIWKKKHEEAVTLLENEYQLRKELLMAYSDPKSLKNSTFYNTCKEYIDAITTHDKQKMYSVWKSLFESKHNEETYSSTKDAFNAKWNDQRKDDYALIDLINAFSNCANHSFRPKVNEDGTLFKAFEKVFVQLKRDCDEP